MATGTPGEPPQPAPSPVVIVLTTLPQATDAAAFARRLVEEGLVACVSIGAEMTSIYRWNDAIEQAGERQLVLKTVRDSVAAIKARMTALHPYEVPEFLVFESDDGSDAYVTWVRQCTRT